MGVPAFFRWLSRKYPNIIVHCVEEKGQAAESDERFPIDTSKPNPNNVEFDNLYLDMNGIIHPCCHPENKAAPKDEDEMMAAIFEYIDRIFAIIRPRRLLYMAIDGVAPRAKMNQQRSRRFRASKEAAEKADSIAKLRQELLRKGYNLPPEKAREEHFDSNCITPGTPFMDRLAKCLHYYIHDRLNNDPGWKNIEVILSDANVPGEGEHKIMDFIRKQRASPSHDPNTKHCLCGADADLIMLGLATHEPYFTIIREEFKPNQPRPCELCSQIGHDMKDCMGLPKDYANNMPKKVDKICGAETEFIFIRLNVLKEYLTKELWIEGLNIKWSIDRAVDDWVFLCFFVGNDFLPHLPSLEIREGAIDRLIRIYKETIHTTQEYLTKDGFAVMSHVAMILTKLGEAEDEIFRQRQADEERFKRRQKDRQQMRSQEHAQPAYISGGQYAPLNITGGSNVISNPMQEIMDQRRTAMQHGRGMHTGAGLQSMMVPEGQAPAVPASPRKEEEEPEDEVRLWEDGWKERYYESKFEVPAENQSFRHEVAAAYAEGLCWVLHYYFQGCASWKWFFPYHYAPFASDFGQIGDLNIKFEVNTQPFNPMEQLMSVFPAASRQHLPEPWGDLMEDPESPIIDFYPTDFRIDLNGKKAAWMGVALLPFVDEKRLLNTVATVYNQLTPEEVRRNSRGDNFVFIRKGHTGYAFLRGLYESKSQRQYNDEAAHPIDPDQFYGLTGTALTTDKMVPEKETVLCPVRGLGPVPNNMAVVLRWRDPVFKEGYIYRAIKLDGAEEPEKVLRPEDLVQDQTRQWRPQVGMARNNQRATLDQSGHRMVNHYGNVRPPRNYNDNRGGRGGYQNDNYGGHRGGQNNYGQPRNAFQRNASEPQWDNTGYTTSNNRGGYGGNRNDNYGGGGYNQGYGGNRGGQDGGYRQNQGRFNQQGGGRGRGGYGGPRGGGGYGNRGGNGGWSQY